MSDQPIHDLRVSTGVSGLDSLLCGGLPRGRFHLVQGDPGAGKTTLALQFLLEGLRRGEKVLYVTLSETREELAAVARSHGWELGEMPLFDLSAGLEHLAIEEENTLFESAEVELAEVMRKLLAEIARVQPTRIVFDSLSEMRLLAQSALRYRRQLLALKQHFARLDVTVLMTDDRTSESGDLQLQSLAHGVLSLEHLSPAYGSERRRIRILKMRGSQIRGGFHDFRIARGGLQIFERLVAAEHHTEFTSGVVPSGGEGIDRLFGGGLDRGTSALFLGAAGTGKSALALQYATAAAERGEAATIYAFDEGLQTLKARGRALGMRIDELIEKGPLVVQQIDPAEMSPGEFIHELRADVDRRNTKVVVVDSLNGYLAAMPEEQFLVIQLHEVLSYLRQRGILVILVVTQSGMLGTMTSPVDVSYLADTAVLLRFYESRGEVRKAISVVKRRAGQHSPAICELLLDSRGVHAGRQLDDLEGILTGVPRLPKAIE